MTGPTVIAVGARAPVYEGRATLFDGVRPVPVDVTLRFDDDADALVIERDDAEPLRWPYDALRAQRDQARPDDGLILSLAGGDLVRLMLDPRDTRLIHTRAHSLHRRSHPVRWRRIALLVLAALVAVALMTATLLPDLPGRLVRTAAALMDADPERSASCARPDAPPDGPAAPAPCPPS